LQRSTWRVMPTLSGGWRLCLTEIEELASSPVRLIRIQSRQWHRRIDPELPRFHCWTGTSQLISVQTEQQTPTKYRCASLITGCSTQGWASHDPFSITRNENHQNLTVIWL
jgi:hypothetical protein